ncbi:hypothetical protein Goklo_001418, partial [Gossypium klotzschianum]|nr:hypothetical protein [Gossypium klotzschianum]
TLSSWATSRIEEVASTGPCIRFFQLYVYVDRNVVAQLVRRAERASFKADDSILASYVARQIDHTLNWKTDYASFAPRITIQGGVVGIIVSNHGARQLDYVPPTIIALTEVVKFAQGRTLVFLDGGSRRRNRCFQTLTLGASG